MIQRRHLFNRNNFSAGHLWRILRLLLIVEICLADLPHATAERRFTVEDDIRMVVFRRPFSDVADGEIFSPDGRYFTVSTERGLVRQNRVEGTLRVFRTKDVRVFLRGADISSEPSPFWVIRKSPYKDGPIITQICWLADSSGIAFLAKTETGNDRLFLADLKTRHLQPLTPENQQVHSFDIRDRNHFVYSIESPAIRERLEAQNNAAMIVATGWDLTRLLFPASTTNFHDLSELWAVVNGKRFRVQYKSTAQPIHLYYRGRDSLALSPDGRFVVTVLAVSTIPSEWETLYRPPKPGYWARITAGKQDLDALDGLEYVSQYVLIELSTGAVRVLVNAPIGDTAGWSGLANAAWSFDGRFVALSNTFLPPPGQAPTDQPLQPCVAIVDLSNSRLSCVVRLKAEYEDNFRIIENVHFARNSGAVLILDFEEEDASKGVVQVAESYLRSAGGTWAPIQTSERSATAEDPIEVSVKQSLNDPPVLVATDKTTGISRMIWNPNPEFKDIKLGDAYAFSWKDKNGRDWIGGLYKPPGYVRGRRYPLVIQTHGFAPKYFLPSGLFPSAFAARELAAAGILVLQVQDCHPSSALEEGLCNVSGYEAAVENLVEEGLVDQDRVGIVGFSRTCYYVLQALTDSTVRFKAASITDGINAGYWQYMMATASAGAGFLRDMEALNGGRPLGAGLQQWLERSPTFNMDKVRAPLLVVANGRSNILFMWEAYAALYLLDKPVELILLRDGTHVMSNPSQRRASQGGTVDWFRFWLNSEEDPEPAKTKQYIRWRDLRTKQDRHPEKSNSK
jgi:dipeptidyl aminopeptidase/acylaminoacyl peptidase